MAEDEKSARKKIPGDIGETEFNAWKHHPVTKAYFKYLLDQRADIRDAAVDAWEGGKLNLAIADEMRGAANTHKRNAEPKFDEIIEFYAEIDQIKKQEMEANGQPDRIEGAEG